MAQSSGDPREEGPMKIEQKPKECGILNSRVKRFQGEGLSIVLSIASFFSHWNEK